AGAVGSRAEGAEVHAPAAGAQTCFVRSGLAADDGEIVAGRMRQIPERVPFGQGRLGLGPRRGRREPDQIAFLRLRLPAARYPAVGRAIEEAVELAEIV